MTNYAEIILNESRSLIETNDLDGNVLTNRGIINKNLGFILTNHGGTVGTVNQYGIVTGNTGEVDNNTEKGIVLNLAGGVVDKNSGTVYNYGGTVQDKGNGTEYFSVKVSNSNSVSTASGLTQAYNQDWLGQTGTAVSTATITISPASGYRITNVSGFGDNVSAIKNDDGTWTLTISSGINTSIDVASALINNPTNPINPTNPSDPFDPSKIKIEVEPEPDNSNQENPPGQNQNPAAPSVTIPIIDTSAATLAAATWDGTAIKIGDTAVTVTALAVQDCAAITSTTATQAELALVYENIFINAIAANNGSVAGARDEALKVVTAFAGYLSEDIPVNYTMAQVATYKVTYMNAFLKAIADGKTLKKARSAGRSAANTAVMNLIFMGLNEGNPVLSIENAIAE